MIDDAHIESDEDGFHLILDGDFVEEANRYVLGNDFAMRVRLSGDAAIALCAAARVEIQPWVDEREREFRAYTAATPEERLAVIGGGAGDPDDDEADEAEQQREWADHSRKVIKEGGRI